MATITIQYNCELGRGAFGTVYRGTRDGRAVAIKVPHLAKRSQSSPHYLKTELDLMMNDAVHRNIVRCYGSCIRPYGIILELCNGSLQTFCQRRDWYLAEGMLVSILKQLNAGLLHLHEQFIVHR